MRKKGKVASQVEDVVLVHDDGPRLFWRINRIMKLYRSPDHECMVTQIKAGAEVTTRQVVKLYPLEADLIVDDDSKPSSDPQAPTTEVKQTGVMLINDHHGGLL